MAKRDKEEYLEESDGSEQEEKPAKKAKVRMRLARHAAKNLLGQILAFLTVLAQLRLQGGSASGPQKNKDGEAFFEVHPNFLTSSRTVFSLKVILSRPFCA
jgi:hypothetical protein